MPTRRQLLTNYVYKRDVNFLSATRFINKKMMFDKRRISECIRINFHLIFQLNLLYFTKSIHYWISLFLEYFIQYILIFQNFTSVSIRYIKIYIYVSYTDEFGLSLALIFLVKYMVVPTIHSSNFPNIV